MEVPPADSLTAILSAIDSIFDAAIEMAGTVGTTIVGNKLLLFGVVVSFVGLGVGLFKRLLRV